MKPAELTQGHGDQWTPHPNMSSQAAAESRVWARGLGKAAAPVCLLYWVDPSVQQLEPPSLRLQAFSAEAGPRCTPSHCGSTGSRYGCLNI